MHGNGFDALKHVGNLPSSTGVGLAILRATQREDFVLGHVARMIQTDPALTGRILKLANAQRNSTDRAIVSVEDAVMRLSVGSVRTVALGFTLVTANRSDVESSFDHEHYWSQSLVRGVAARFLAAERGDVDPSMAFTCGLIAGLGRLALATFHPEEYAAVLSSGEGLGDDAFLEHERRELGIDHAQLCASMLRDWGMPEALAHAVYSFERPLGALIPPSEASANLEAVLRGAAQLGDAAAHGNGLSVPRREVHANDTAFLSRALAVAPAAVVRLRQAVLDEWSERVRVLEVPICAPAPAKLGDTAMQRRDRSGARRGLRILAVDDDPVTLRLLQHHLAIDGHSVQSATNGAEALALALKTQPQMIVTDLSMPEMDGLGLTRALRASNVCALTYILVVTGHGEESRVVEAFEAGADEFVSKPFNANILKARVRAGQRMIELRERVESDKQELNRQNAQMITLNRKLNAAAMTDVLTELPNRRYAIRRLDEEMALSLAAGTPLSVILLDIDHFKRVNDTHGHDVGDLVLREAARALRSCTRKNEEVCRMGGEEFLVIVPQSTRDASAYFAERLRQAVESLELAAPGYKGRVTVSLGVAGLEDGARTVDELIKIADTRAYLAKAQGRNCVVASGGDESQSKSA